MPKSFCVPSELVVVISLYNYPERLQVVCVVSLIPRVLVFINNPKHMNRLQLLCSGHSCAAIAVLQMKISVELMCHQTAIILHLARDNCYVIVLKNA